MQSSSVAKIPPKISKSNYNGINGITITSNIPVNNRYETLSDLESASPVNNNVHNKLSYFSPYYIFVLPPIGKSIEAFPNPPPGDALCKGQPVTEGE